MMESVEGFKAALDVLDSGMTTVDLSRRDLLRDDTGLHYPDVGYLTERSMKNLAKSLSIPKGLLRDLKISTLNILVKEQMVRKGNHKFRMSVTDDQIHFLQPDQNPYLSYSRILEGVDEKEINFVRGNPVLDEMIQVFFKTAEYEPDDGHPLYLGHCLNISDTCSKPPVINPMTYRLICTNGLMETRKIATYRVSVDASNEMMIRDMVISCIRNTQDMTDRQKEFINFAGEHVLKANPIEVIEEIEEVTNIPNKTVQSAKVYAQNLLDGDDTLSEVGIDELNTVWSYINLMTYVVQNLTSYVAITRTEQSMYAWGRSKFQL